MSAPSQMYTLKYKLKYALECQDPAVISEAEKKQLRQVEHMSKTISRSVYVYAPLDLLATAVWLKRQSSGQGTAGKSFVHRSLSSQRLASRQPVLAAFAALRVSAVYYLSSEMSKKYLVDGITPILRDKDPMREGMLDTVSKL